MSRGGGACLRCFVRTRHALVVGWRIPIAILQLQILYITLIMGIRRGGEFELMKQRIRLLGNYPRHTLFEQNPYPVSGHYVHQPDPGLHSFFPIANFYDEKTMSVFAALELCRLLFSWKTLHSAAEKIEGVCAAKIK